MEGRIEVTGRRGRIRKQLLDNLKKKRKKKKKRREDTGQWTRTH